MRNWKKRYVDPSFKVGISIVTYNQTHCLASLIHSIRSQGYDLYRGSIIHDGPWTDLAFKTCQNAIDGDTRFEMLASETRANKFGHNLRQIGFDRAVADGCNWLCTMNGDCWYAPTYFEWMLSKATESNANFIYSNLVHSHTLWQPLRAEVRRGCIDAGSWIAHTSLVGDTKWDNLSFAGDWDFIKRLKEKPNFKPAKVEGFIYVHN